MTDRVARLIELYQLLHTSRDYNGASWRAEQMRLLSEMTDKESTTYYHAVAAYRRTIPTVEELIEWPG